MVWGHPNLGVSVQQVLCTANALSSEERTGGTAVLIQNITGCDQSVEWKIPTLVYKGWGNPSS